MSPHQSEVRRRREEDSAKMVTAYEMGHPITAIARAAGVSGATVYARLQQEGCKLRGKTGRPRNKPTQKEPE